MTAGRLLLWSSGQEFLAKDPEARVLFPALPDILRSSGSGTGKKKWLQPKKPENTAVGIRCADHATPYIRKKLTLTSSTCGGLSVGIVYSRTKATEFNSFYFLMTAGSSGYEVK
jgi:hypothetical protein